LILYVDTSALVPLLISEAGSQVCGGLWDRADRVITARLTYVEAAAALAIENLLADEGPQEGD